MHRVLALLLIPALMGTAGVASSLHTHDYEDHDHPEHHHGLAAHEHFALTGASDDGRPHLERCDPGNHTVAYIFVSAVPPGIEGADGDSTLPEPGVPGPTIEPAVRHADVRVHGPPPRTHASPRAPPVIALA